MEIERKFLIDSLPENLSEYPSWLLEQAYLCRKPVVRVRREERGEDKRYILTYKSQGMMVREEYNLPLDEDAYLHLREKADGRVIRKKRYRIPIDQKLTVELDVFEGELEGLVLAEVEFPDEETAKNWQSPQWFCREVTYEPTYHNSNLSRQDLKL